MADQNQTDQSQGMMADVQRALSFAVIGAFCAMLMAITAKVVWAGAVEQNIDILKIALPATITFAGTCLGFYFGSSKSKEQTDASQAQLVDKLTPLAAPTPPVPTSPVQPWWGRLSDAEKNTITAAAQNTGGAPDPRVGAFITASQVGAATPGDLAYLVQKGLLTQARADEIKGS